MLGRGAGVGVLYLTLHCHQHDSALRWAAMESHFNALLTAMGQVTRQCPQTTTFEELGQPEAGSRTDVVRLPAERLNRSAIPVYVKQRVFSVDLRVCSRSMGFSKPLYDDARDKFNG